MIKLRFIYFIEQYCSKVSTSSSSSSNSHHEASSLTPQLITVALGKLFFSDTKEIPLIVFLPVPNLDRTLLLPALVALPLTRMLLCLQREVSV